MTLRALPLVLPLLLLGAPMRLDGQACATSPADTTDVLRVAEGIVAGDNDRDLERVLGYYAPDAVLLPPGEPPVRGHDAIRPRYVSLFAQYDPAIEGEIDAIEICRDLAVVTGRNGGWLRARDRTADRRLRDAYVMVLRRSDGEWRISRLMWHPDGR
jgi:uncharacterized protein (TIGR02246 family)